MSEERDWVSERLGEARKNHQLVTDEASALLARLLKGAMSTKVLKPTEHIAVANELLAAMKKPASSQGSEKCESNK